MKWYLKVLKQYADFRGRARRTEYWMFALFNLIFSIGAALIDNLLHDTFTITDLYGDAVPVFYGYVYITYTFAMIIPSLAVSVRRLHDIGKSGWMMLVSLIPFIGAIWLLVLFCSDSQPGSNKWGHNPKEPIPVDGPQQEETFYV